MTGELILRLKNTKSEHEVVEAITVEAESAVARGEGPTTIVNGVVDAGFPHLASLAAERHHHAWVNRESTRTETTAARSAPIFRDDKSTLHAAFSPFLSEDSFPLFADRLLAAVLDKPTTKVVFVPPAQNPTGGFPKNLIEQMNELRRDLEFQRITVIAPWLNY